MVQALIFDCFGVLITDTPEAVRSGNTKNQALLDLILKLRQHYKIGLLSNITAEGLASRFSQEELAQHFDCIGISDSMEFAKPQPEAFRHIAEQLGVAADKCIMIDDTDGHCQGARSTGMQTVLYRSFEQCKQELEALLGEQL